jgi:membrane associated rhomboid family serine protease
MFGNLPPVTRGLILVNVAVFLLEAMFGINRMTVYLGLWPISTASFYGGMPGFQPWQIITYGFLHGSVMHIFVNMFALFMFGGQLERLFGPKRYLNLYLASIITAGLSQLAYAAITGAEPYPTIGASGGVFGLLLAFAMYFPRQTIVLLIPPIPMPAWLFVTLYGLLELFLGVSGREIGVAHFAHLGGMVGAWLMIQYWRGRPPFRRRR